MAERATGELAGISAVLGLLLGGARGPAPREMPSCSTAEKGLPGLEGFPCACATFSQVSGGRRDTGGFGGGHEREGHGQESPENRDIRGIIWPR